jgi:hypothetical protein
VIEYDEDLARQLIRAAILSGAGNWDAAGSITNASAKLVADVSDDLVRELFWFLSGVATALVMFGMKDAGELAQTVQLVSPTPEQMREAIKAGLALISGR